ncbi:MAG: LemA family protein [Erysipelotrichaceae bacterium]|nr:LemA family protein [Erysipelotrichaceae bacterium]
MPNELDETDVSTINEAGRDVHVIEKKVAVKLDGTDKFINVFLWFLPLPIISGFIYTLRKTKAKNYLQQLQQKIQHAASTIDNYQLQRVTILQNTAKLVEKATDLDKSTFTEIARLRSGTVSSDEARLELADKLNAAEKAINVAFENYPDLKAHGEIRDAMQQNAYLQQEITAAREIYNDAVLRWNTEIFQQWAKKYVAAKAGYTTRIPFTVSADIKAQSQGVFF